MPITEYGDGAIPSDFESFDVIPDSVYGSGMDGNVQITSNTTLARDMFYNNLTIDPGIVLNTAGYRVFVRNTLAMAATSSNQSDTKIGRVGGVSTTGTLKPGGLAAVTNSLGGNGNGYTATAPDEGCWTWQNPQSRSPEVWFWRRFHDELSGISAVHSERGKLGFGVACCDVQNGFDSQGHEPPMLPPPELGLQIQVQVLRSSLPCFRSSPVRLSRSEIYLRDEDTR